MLAPARPGANFFHIPAPTPPSKNTGIPKHRLKPEVFHAENLK